MGYSVKYSMSEISITLLRFCGTKMLYSITLNTHGVRLGTSMFHLCSEFLIIITDRGCRWMKHIFLQVQLWPKTYRFTMLIILKSPLHTGGKLLLFRMAKESRSKGGFIKSAATSRDSTHKQVSQLKKFSFVTALRQFSDVTGHLFLTILCSTLCILNVTTRIRKCVCFVHWSFVRNQKNTCLVPIS